MCSFCIVPFTRGRERRCASVFVCTNLFSVCTLHPSLSLSLYHTHSLSLAVSLPLLLPLSLPSSPSVSLSLLLPPSLISSPFPLSPPPPLPRSVLSVPLCVPLFYFWRVDRVRNGCSGNTRVSSLVVLGSHQFTFPSRALPSIVDEIRQLADAGYREVLLLGQNVNSYHDRETVYKVSPTSNGKRTDDGFVTRGYTTSRGFTNMFR